MIATPFYNSHFSPSRSLALVTNNEVAPPLPPPGKISIKRLVPKLFFPTKKQNYIQLDAIINPWLVCLDGLETVWTVWKRSHVSGTMPEVSEIQL